MQPACGTNCTCNVLSRDHPAIHHRNRVDEYGGEFQYPSAMNSPSGRDAHRSYVELGSRGGLGEVSRMEEAQYIFRQSTSTLWATERGRHLNASEISSLGLMRLSIPTSTVPTLIECKEMHTDYNKKRLVDH